MRVLAPLFALLLLTAPAVAQEVPATVTVIGEGTAAAAPDSAELSLAVETRAETADAAFAAASERMGRVMAALEGDGIAPEAMQTTGISMRPERAPREMRAESGVPEIEAYVAVQRLLVRIAPLERLGAVIDTTVDAGANRIESVRFDIEERAALEATARRAAIADARAAAEAYAAAAGHALGRIVSISESGVVSPRPTAGVAMEAARSAPIAPGTTEVGARVTVVWALGGALD